MAGEYGTTEYGSVPGGSTDVEVNVNAVTFEAEPQTPDVNISKDVAADVLEAAFDVPAASVTAKSRITGGPAEATVEPQSPTVETTANVDVQGASVGASVGANAVTVSGDAYHDEGVAAQQLTFEIPSVTVTTTRNVDVTAGPADMQASVPSGYEVQISKEVELTNTPSAQFTANSVTVTVEKNVEVSVGAAKIDMNVGQYFAIADFWENKDDDDVGGNFQEKDGEYDDTGFWSEKDTDYDDGSAWDDKDPQY